VNDLQTLTLAEAGQLPMHPQKFQAADLLADVATSFAGQAAEQGVELAVDAPQGAETLELYADADRLDQVLSNLVANALRYTPGGGCITLRLRPESEAVLIVVQDNGAGIPAEDLPYVFDRFWRGDRARSRGQGAGSGLGLAIARQLIQAHGGTIQVESQPGQGTTFSIQLPRASDPI
jgi:signal transduction histidine kinase